MTITTKERSIVMPAPSVRALLAGAKTQHRVIVKPQPTHQLIEGLGHVAVGMNPADDGAVWYDADCINPGREVRCPFGRVGDRLFCRETYRYEIRDGVYGVRYKADDTFRPCSQGLQRACVAVAISDMPHGVSKWRSPTVMPSWISRLTLQLTGVKVERLQDITEADAVAEGFAPTIHYKEIDVFDRQSAARDGYAEVWVATHGPGSWAANPFCWALSFTVL